MHFLNKTIYKVIFFIIVIILMFTPVIPDKFTDMMFFLGLNDKEEHFIAFFLLSFLLNRASSTIKHRLRNVIALLTFGIMIEVIQYFIPNRSMSALDVLADFSGIIVFQVLFSIYIYFKQKNV